MVGPSLREAAAESSNGGCRCGSTVGVGTQKCVAVDEPVKQLMAVGMQRDQVLVLLPSDPSTVAVRHAAVVDVMQLELSSFCASSACSALQRVIASPQGFLTEPAVPAHEPDD